MSFLLEVKGWVDFEVERTFEDVVEARRFGTERFSQNAWRIRDNSDHRILYDHDPMEVIEGAASSEITRFERKDRWMRQMANQQIQAERARQHMAQVAQRQRRVQRIRKKKRKEVVERFNWMVEGF